MPLVESDNVIEYKSLEHMYLIQDLSNSINIDIIHYYGISQHGKSELF